MTTLIVDDLDIPPSTIASAIVNRVPLNEDKNCHIEHWSTRWRIEKDGKRTCLEVSYWVETIENVQEIKINNYRLQIDCSR